MARVKGGLFSLSASGSIADTLTFSSSRGRPYVRLNVTPSNPKTVPQQAARSVAKYCSENYSSLPAADQADWVEAGRSKNITGLNQWVKDSSRQRLNGNGIRSSPLQAEGVAPGAPTAVVATGGSGQVTLTWVNSVVGTPYTTIINRGATGFTPSGATWILVVVNSQLQAIITGLDPGTYFFRVRHAEEGGVMGTAAAEVSAVVT